MSSVLLFALRKSYIDRWFKPFTFMLGHVALTNSSTLTLTHIHTYEHKHIHMCVYMYSSFIPFKTALVSVDFRKTRFLHRR